MEALMINAGPEQAMEQKWSLMFVLALLFHVAVFSLIFFFPSSMPTRRLDHIVYEVDLVESPGPKTQGVNSPSRGKEIKILKTPAKPLPTKVIGPPPSLTKQKAVPIAEKITVKPQKITAPPKESPAKLLDEALAKIEKKVQEENSRAAEDSQVEDQAGPKTETQPRQGEGTSGTGSGSQGQGASGFVLGIYSADVKERIRNNWSYVDLSDTNSTQTLATLVELEVAKNGTIVRTTITRSSGNSPFDQSVLKAIQRSDPLPPVPEGLSSAGVVFEINFNNTDLMNR
jgi:colicin import membrane protein